MIKQQGITVVDFWAPWCGPCKAMHEVLDRIEKKYQNISIVKINIEDVDNLEIETIISENGIRAIPYIAIYKNGAKVDSVIGVVPDSHVEGIIDKLK